jgi:hypothetical protein
MLGELLGESAGKITGTRVLPSEGQQVKVEVSGQGSGQLLGEAMTDMFTYWQTVRPGGVFYGEGHVLLMTPSGEIAAWSGFGVGQPTGPSPAAHYAVCGSFQPTNGCFCAEVVVFLVVSRGAADVSASVLTARRVSCA